MKPNSIKPSSLKPSVSSVLFVPFLTKKTLPSHHQHSSSCTYSTNNPRANGILLIMPSEPNFQTPRPSVTLAMIRTYNANCPKKHKKSKPNPNPIRTRSKPNPNPIQTQPNPKRYSRNLFRIGSSGRRRNSRRSTCDGLDID